MFLSKWQGPVIASLPKSKQRKPTESLRAHGWVLNASHVPVPGGFKRLQFLGCLLLTCYRFHFWWFNGKPLSWQKFKALTSKHNAPTIY